MSETKTPVTIRIPPDVLTPARARAEAEHRTFTDAAVRLLRAYGEGDPAALAIVAGVPSAVIEMHLSASHPATRARAPRATKDAAPAAAASKSECPPHPKGRLQKNGTYCGACGQHVS